jgi:hypothetical protein
MGRDGGKPRLTMDNKREWPRVVTPEGNWAP